MCILVGYAGFGGGSFDAQMVEVTRGTTQPIANVAQGLAFAQVAKDHGNQMSPRIESFRMLVATMLADDFFEEARIKMRDYLGKDG